MHRGRGAFGERAMSSTSAARRAARWAGMRAGIVAGLAGACVVRADPVEVRIEHFAFTPETVVVGVGQAVRWTNYDSIEHTATSQTGQGTLVPSGVFDSGLMNVGDRFVAVFHEAGTYHYFCVPHGSSMQGVVIVRETPACAADFNGDGLVDPDDLADAIACYLSVSVCHEADANGDGQVDPDDLADLIAAYFLGCP